MSNHNCVESRESHHLTIFAVKYIFLTQFDSCEGSFAPSPQFLTPWGFSTFLQYQRFIALAQIRTNHDVRALVVFQVSPTISSTWRTTFCRKSISSIPLSSSSTSRTRAASGRRCCCPGQTVEI